MGALVVMVIALGALVGLPVMAFRRIGFRGAYLAVAIGGLVLGAGCGIMPTSTSRELATMTADQRRGAEVIDASSEAFMSIMFSVAVGGLLGACLYRPPDQ
jgi:hypothetical protein